MYQQRAQELTVNRKWKFKKVDHQKLPLLGALKQYGEEDIAAFDVPGHKRGKGVKVLRDYLGAELMKLDVNSLPLLDNVSNPKGVIAASQSLLADAYQSDAAFFMTNGTTSAIHCMLMSVLSPGDKVLLPRNIHKSALNGLILCGAIPVYLPTEFMNKEGISANVDPQEIEQALINDREIKAVFLLNPTYYGFVTDLKKVIKISHERNVLVLVDEAHGAHFPFHEALPPSAMELGADISCVSLHKTGGALTQASAMLVNSSRVDVMKVQQVINMLQSTSASYLLMGSLDGARQNLVLHGHEQLSHVIALSRYAREELNQIRGIHLIQPHDSKGPFDLTKLGIHVSGLGLTGFEVYDLLWKEFNIQLEMADLNNVLAIISLGDTLGNIERLIEAFRVLSKRFTEIKTRHLSPIRQIKPEVKLSPRDAYFSTKELVLLEESSGKISGESILAYPPGVPIIAPGELITNEVILTLKQLVKSGAFLTDQTDKNLNHILVVKQREKGVLNDA